MIRSLAACALIAAMSATAAADPDPALANEIAALRAELADNPDNLELRLKLAFRLSWAGDRAGARREATAVSEKAPDDRDAQVLLARLDAWDGDYEKARERLERVLAAEPKRPDALALATDVELWSGAAAAARRAADDLVAVDSSPAALFRRARAAKLAMRPLETRRWARRVLDADPGHEGARLLLGDAPIASFSSASELEVYPAARDSVALGQTISATVFPGGYWSATVGYEYRRRFGTNNHLGSLGVNRRFSKHLGGFALVRAGSAEVVPELTGVAGVTARVADHYSVGLRYRLDKMPWPGQLHRAIADAGVGLPGGVEMSASYFAGGLRNCGDTDLAQGVSLRARVQRGRLWASAVYGFGMELERAPLPPFLEDQFGDDVCSFLGDAGLELIDTRATIGGGEIGWGDPGWLEIRGGYTHQYRHSGERVHASFLGIRLWL